MSESDHWMYFHNFEPLFLMQRYEKFLDFLHTIMCKNK
ncbi:Uncharacterised protein [Brucella anthropi]|nr:hypothetical protein DR92_956 [Brucella anthropi]SUA65904.1 Uncharacterised protein [Brucella anthropi]